MWVLKVGEEGKEEQSYPCESFSSHLMMKVVVVVVVIRV